jgi:hypothetical protein
MANDEPRGAVHWIDHRVVGTNDLVKWVDWAVKATGAVPWPMIGITTAARKRNSPINCFLDFAKGARQIGAFLQPEVYPEGKGLGKELPRCAFRRAKDSAKSCPGAPSLFVPRKWTPI